MRSIRFFRRRRYRPRVRKLYRKRRSTFRRRRYRRRSGTTFRNNSIVARMPQSLVGLAPAVALTPIPVVFAPLVQLADMLSVTRYKGLFKWYKYLYLEYNFTFEMGPASSKSAGQELPDGSGGYNTVEQTAGAPTLHMGTFNYPPYEAHPTTLDALRCLPSFKSWPMVPNKNYRVRVYAKDLKILAEHIESTTTSAELPKRVTWAPTYQDQLNIYPTKHVCFWSFSSGVWLGETLLVTVRRHAAVKFSNPQ